MKNMDNKCLKNERKTASSSYLPRSSNSKQRAGKPYKLICSSYDSFGYFHCLPYGERLEALRQTENSNMAAEHLTMGIEEYGYKSESGEVLF